MAIDWEKIKNDALAQAKVWLHDSLAAVSQGTEQDLAELAEHVAPLYVSQLEEAMGGDENAKNNVDLIISAISGKATEKGIIINQAVFDLLEKAALYALQLAASLAKSQLPLPG